MEIIVLSSIMTVLFIVFGVLVYREFSKPETKVFDIENSPRAQFIRYIGKVFDQADYRNSTPQVKEMILNNIRTVVADMESEGVYFSPEIKEELKKRREEITCEYSGLPSVKSYME